MHPQLDQALFPQLGQVIPPLLLPYRAPSVMEKRAEVSRVVEDLFPIYLGDPHQMPARWHAEIDAAPDDTALARIVSDYISGMTDRFALQDHARLTGADQPGL